MKRVRALAAIAALGVLLAPLPAAATVSTGVQDFEFESFHARYELGLDEDGLDALGIG